MKQSITLVLMIIAVALASCAKEQKEVAQDLGLVPEGCGNAGMRMEASVDGGSYCPDAQLIAVGDTTSVIITGIDLMGTTLIVQLDDIVVGEHTITEAANSVLYMHTGMNWVVPQGAEGVLIVSAHHADARHIQGSFSVALFNEMNGTTRQVEGSFDVTYAEGQ